MTFSNKVNKLISSISISILGNDTFMFKIEKDKKGGNRLYLQIEYRTPCTKTAEILPWKGRKWYLSEHMTDNEIIFTAYTAYEMAMKHEIMESFKINGVILLNPHVDYKQLLEISNKETVREPH